MRRSEADNGDEDDGGQLDDDQRRFISAEPVRRSFAARLVLFLGDIECGVKRPERIERCWQAGNPRAITFDVTETCLYRLNARGDDQYRQRQAQKLPQMREKRHGCYFQLAQTPPD